MSVEKAKEFFLMLKEKAPDDALVEKKKSAKTEDDCLQLYAEIAGSMGYDLSEADIKEAFFKLEAERRAKTQAAKQEMEALDDEELKNVAGGAGNEEEKKCMYDFEDDDCLYSDACTILNVMYFDCTDSYY